MLPLGIRERYLPPMTESHGDSRSRGTTADLLGVSSDAYGFVAVGTGGVILISQDSAVTWTMMGYGATYNLAGVTYGDGIFIAVGEYSTIVSSMLGSGWAVRTSGTAKRMSSVTYGNGTFMAVGDGSTALMSSDGGLVDFNGGHNRYAESAFPFRSCLWWRDFRSCRRREHRCHLCCRGGLVRTGSGHSRSPPSRGGVREPVFRCRR